MTDTSEVYRPRAVEAAKIAFAAGGLLPALADYEQVIRVGIAEEIRAELVCCDAYDGVHADRAERAGHAICYWGEACAQLVEERD